MNSNRTKKQKPKRKSFAANFNVSEDDLILADLDVMLDEEEPSPVPLNHFMDDEETLDRLLINSGFEANDEREKDEREPYALVIDDINFAHDFSGLDQFVVEPIELTRQNYQQETEEIPDSDFYLMADFDEIPDEEDAIDKLLVDAGFDANVEQEQGDENLNALVIDDKNRAQEFVVNIKEQSAMVADTGNFHSEESELAPDKDAINVVSANEENPESAMQEQAIKKQLNDYENKVEKAAFITYISLGFGVVALLSARVMGVIVSSMQTKVSKLTELVSILEDDMTTIAGKNSDSEISNENSSVEPLSQKINGLPGQFEEQIPSSSDISENVRTSDEKKQATVNKTINQEQTKSPVSENKNPSKAADKMGLSGKKGNNTHSAAGWSVILTAYEDLSYAKNKAEKFIKKGVPVKVIAVEMNNTKWYRLKVGGFKNEEEATAYAAKIKNLLNLKTVSTDKN
jgi:hypothetical protein